MATSNQVSDCSAMLYCTKVGTPLKYNEPFTVYWNNNYSPLNPQQRVSISVYSIYDFSKPLYTTDMSNMNGVATLTPDPKWYSRYTGADSNVGENQKIYFAVYLEGNDVPSSNNMLELTLTATNSEYKEIQSILAAASASAEAATATTPVLTAKSSATVASGSATSKTMHDSASSATMSVDSDSLSMYESMHNSTLASSSLMEESEMSSLLSGSITNPTATPTSTPSTNTDHKSSARLSSGAIAGIAVGSAVGLALLALLLFLLMRRNKRSKAALEKGGGAGLGPSSSSDGGSADAAKLAAGGAAAAGLGIVTGAGRRQDKGPNRSPSDTPLLTFAGKPNNSFNSRDDSLSEHSPAYQPINLDTPRIYANIPKSTRTPKDAGPILTADDALQLGNVFRDALRKPPPVSEDGNSNSHGHRESMLLAEEDENELSEEELDPGWRERVASERMQRELEQEASVIRTVALRAHGSDYSSSRPETSQSASSSHRLPHSPIDSNTDKTFSS